MALVFKPIPSYTSVKPLEIDVARQFHYLAPITERDLSHYPGQSKNKRNHERGNKRTYA